MKSTQKDWDSVFEWYTVLQWSMTVKQMASFMRDLWTAAAAILSPHPLNWWHRYFDDDAVRVNWLVVQPSAVDRMLFDCLVWNMEIKITLSLLTSGGLAKNSEPIPFEYSCQVTSGVNKAMLSHWKQYKCTELK